MKNKMNMKSKIINYMPNNFISFIEEYHSNNLDNSDNINSHVVQELLNGRTVLIREIEERNFIQKLLLAVKPELIMHYLSNYMLPNMYPNIVKKYNLEKIYEQLVFYEYIYMSPNVSLFDKIAIIAINNYYELLDLIKTNTLKMTCADYNNSHFKTSFLIKENKKIFDLAVNIHDEYIDNSFHNYYHCNLINSVNSVNLVNSVNSVNPNITIKQIILLMNNMENKAYVDLFYKKDKKLKKICQPEIIEVYKKSFFTFDNIRYILLSDDVESFVFLTRNLNFNTINKIIIEYLPYNILQFIFKKKNNNEHLTIENNPITIEINPMKLMFRTLKEINKTILLINNECSGYKIIWESILYSPIKNNLYKSELSNDCTYITIYWKYMDMLNISYENYENILQLVENSVHISNHLLDFVILKTAIDNFNEIYDDKLDKYIKSSVFSTDSIDSIDSINHNNLLDYDEIIEELIVYGVKNLKYLFKIKELIYFE
jgi:hypothetical protein